MTHETVAMVKLPHYYYGEKNQTIVEGETYEIRKWTGGSPERPYGGIQIVRIGKWKPKAGIKEPKTKDDVEFDPKAETVVVSFTTDRGATDVMLEHYLSVSWFPEKTDRAFDDWERQVSRWEVEDLRKKANELATLKEAFAILSKKEE